MPGSARGGIRGRRGIGRAATRWRWLLAAALGLTLIALDHGGRLLVRSPDDLAAYDGRRFEVTRALDGDTIEIAAPDRLNDRPYTRVRLWGVDAPELAARQRPADTLAVEARAMTHRLVAGRLVLLRLEPHRTRGALGRVLAHVELPDGTSVNETLLRSGLARADDRWPHALLGRYARLDREARRDGAGLWADP